MSLLQQLVDTIGESIGVEYSPSEKPIVEHQKEFAAVVDTRTTTKKEPEKRDDNSSKQVEDPGIEIIDVDPIKDKSATGSKSLRSDETSMDQSSVSFGSVQVREYERVIDSTNIYMGLALGWNYNDKGQAPIKEKNKISKYSVTSSHGGEEKMKRTNGSDRYGMLIRYGYAQKELKQATKEAAKFYKQRSREEARSIVIAEEKTKQKSGQAPKRRPLLRSMFG